MINQFKWYRNDQNNHKHTLTVDQRLVFDNAQDKIEN